MEKNIKVGISCMEYSQLSIEDILKKAKLLGVKYLEIGITENNINMENVHEVRRLVKEYGLKVAALNSDSLKMMDQKLTLTRALGAEYLIVGRDIGIETQESKASSLKNFAKFFKSLLALAAKDDIVIAVENQTIGITRTPEGILEVIDAVGSPYFKVVLDIDNFYNAGEEGYPYAYQLLKDYIGYVHVKDSGRYAQTIYGKSVRVLHRAGIDAVCVPLGEGALNWEGALNSLQNDGYQGFIIIEPHTSPEIMDSSFAKCLEYLKSKGL